jgi:hypothetical protein
MTHRNADCALCSDIGTIARDPSGGYVYCVCRRGLEAHINHLAYVLQEYAEALAVHAARERAGLVTLPPPVVEEIEFAQRVTQHAHDRLEQRWAQVVVDEIEVAEPELRFFPDTWYSVRVGCAVRDAGSCRCRRTGANATDE